MNDTNKRVLGYGIGAVVLAGLVYVGFIHETDADPMTLLGSAEVHIKLARSIPVKDAKGNPNAVRAKLLRDARDFVVRARKQDPELYYGVEMDAFLTAEEGDFEAAARLYRRAQTADRATPETRSKDVLNEARMWRAAKKPDEALAVLTRNESRLSGNNATSSQIEKVFILRDLGRTDKAVKIATSVVRSTQDPMALVDAGRFLESRNEFAVAKAAFEKAADVKPATNYYLARLKIRASEYDSSLDLLQRAMAVDDRWVRKMLKRDREIWQPVHDNARFKKLLKPEGEAAEPGR